MSKNTTALNVLEAHTRDVGRGVARIDYDSMDTVNAASGDVIEITGKRRTVAKCLPLYPSEKVDGVIRMSNRIRYNTRADIGEIISIKAIHTKAAEKVVIRVIGRIPPLDEEYIASFFNGYSIIKGDYLSMWSFDRSLDFEVIGILPLRMQ